MLGGMTVLVFLDPLHPHGRIVDASKPQLMATDLGATRGDGVFESMLARDGKPRKLQAHLERMATSAASLELKIPAPVQWERAIETAIACHNEEDTASELVVKLLVTRGVEGASAPTAWVQVSAVTRKSRQQRETGLAVTLLDRGYNSAAAERAPWLLMGAKTLSYAVNMAALRYAHAAGFDDAIFTSSDGMVLEGPTSTVLLATDRDGVKTLQTPLLKSGVLPGTTQGALFAAANAAGWRLGYGPLVPQDLFDADGVWLASSIRLLAPVNSIDGQSLSTTSDSGSALTVELTALLESAL